MTYLPDAVRQRVRQRAGNRCAYGLGHQAYILGQLQIDHVHPVAKGGTDAEDNLCLACELCKRSTSMVLTSTGVTLADLLERFGPIPAARIRSDPPPGTATEADVLALEAQENRLFELVDGVLVEKAMGFYESFLAIRLAKFLLAFVERYTLGIVAGEAGMLRLAPGLVRIPEVSFVSWNRLPQRRVSRQPIPDLVPDLAVEILSESNTAQEMAQKLREYFTAGVRLLWYVDSVLQEVHVYTAPEQRDRLTVEHTLQGGEILPGFTLPVRQLFAEPADSGEVADSK